MYSVYYVRSGKEVPLSKQDLFIEFPSLDEEFLNSFDVTEIRITDDKQGNIIISKMEE